MDDLKKNLFNNFDEEAKNAELPPAGGKEPMKVYLRIRPFLPKEVNKNEDQACIIVKDNQKIELSAPKDSFAFKSGIRGLADQSHEFTFTHVYKQETLQKDFFDSTMLPFVKDILDGQNGLCFTYGVTNSGKTYTIQGTPKDGGILPRALDVVFNSISKKLYKRANLKPKHCHDVILLNPEEEIKEDNIRSTILNAGQKENADLTAFKLLNSTSKTDETMRSTNNTFLSDISVIQKSGMSLDAASINEELRSRVADSTTINVEQQGNVRFGVWVSFMEIYNEQMFDLLDLSPIGKGKKRPILKLGDDKDKNPYVKGLKEVFVTSSDEAYKILRLGQKNRHIASTKLNQLSSRSHSIFSIKLLKIVDVAQPHVARISRLSIVDLAGSERYCHSGTEGERLREASNINCSIMTLGKCISLLRYNQEHPNNPVIVPFRESKLTRLFQSFFRGKGKASMIVNISQCASVFDETYNVMKFSAVAKQIKMKAQRATEHWRAPPLPGISSGVPSTPSNRPPLTIIRPVSTAKKRTLNDPSLFSYDELVNIVGELRDKLKRERLQKSSIETNVRKEVTEELNELLVEIENSHTEQLQEQKQLLENTMDKRIDLLTKVVNKSRKRKKVDEDDADDSLVPSVLLHAEKMKVKELDDTVLTLQSQISQIKSENNFISKIGKTDQHTKMIEQLKDEIREAKETIDLQNEGIEGMQLNLQRKDDEIDKLNEALDETEEDKEQDKAVIDLQNMLEVTIKELDIARRKLDKRDERIKELESTNNTQKGDNEELVKLSSNHEEWYEISKQKNEALLNEIKELKDLLEEKTEENTVLKSKNADINEKFKDIDEQGKSIQFENDEMSIKLERFEKLNTDLQSSLRDSEEIIKELNERVRNLQHDIDAHETNLKCQVPEISKEINKSDHSNLVKDLELSENTNKEYADKITRLEIQLKNYEQIDIVKEQTQGTPNKKIIDKSAVSAFNKQLSTPVKKQSNTPTRSPYSPATKTNQHAVMKKLEKLLEESTKALEKKTSVVVQKSNKIQILEQQIHIYEKKNNLNEIMSEKERLTDENASLKVEIDNLKCLKDEIDIKYKEEIDATKSLNVEIETWMKKFDNLNIVYKENLERSSNKRQKESEERENLKEECQQRERDISILNIKIKDYENVDNANTKLLDKLEAAEKSLLEFKEVKAQLDNTISNHKHEILELKKIICEKDEVIKKLKSEIDDTASKSQKLQNDLKDRRKSRVAQDQQLSKTVGGFEERIDSLNEHNDELSEELDLVKIDLKIEKDKVLKLTADIEGVKEEKTNLLVKLQHIEEEKEQLQAQIDKLDKDCKYNIIQTETIKSKNLKYEMRIEILQSDFDNTCSKLEKALEDNAVLKNQVSNQSTELTNIQKSYSKLQDESEESFKKIMQLEKEVEHLTEELEALVHDKDKEIFECKIEIEKKDKEICKNKLEMQLTEENFNEVNELKKESIELKEQSEEMHNQVKELKKEIVELKEKVLYKDQEIKQISEEKKVALDELLKQSMKSSQSDTASDDGITIEEEASKILKSNNNTPSNRRIKRHAATTGPRRVTRGMVNNTIDLTIQDNTPVETKRRRRITKKTISETTNQDENNLTKGSLGDQITGNFTSLISESVDQLEPLVETSVNEQTSMVCSVSIACSPMMFDDDEESTNEGEQDCEDTVFEENLSVKIGNFVALKTNSETLDAPVIGKVINIISNTDVEVEMWQGSYTKTWKVKKNEELKIIRKKVSINEILLNEVYFTNSKRLPIDLKRKMVELYDN